MTNASIVDVLAIRAATKQRICFLSIISSIYCDRISSADAPEKVVCMDRRTTKGNVRECNGDDWEDIQMI